MTVDEVVAQAEELRKAKMGGSVGADGRLTVNVPAPVAPKPDMEQKKRESELESCADGISEDCN